MELKTVIAALAGQTGVSGDEFAAAEKAAEFLKKYAENVTVDTFGCVTGCIKCGRENAKTLLLDAHIDQVGLIVTYIDEQGFVGVGKVGSPDLRTLSAQSVTIHGKKPVKGVVSTLPPHVSNDRKTPEIGEIFIDVGLEKAQAEKIISPGDRITINSEFRALSENVVSSPALDDRSGAAAILYALELMKDREKAYNIAVCFSSQEETGERGAKISAFRIRPDEALVVDVSFGKTPDDPKSGAEKLGSGAMIGFSPVLDKKISVSLRNIAQNEKIPYTCEVMPSSTGTNADVIGISGEGVRVCTVSFPIRYMHTCAETADLRDIEAAARLIAEYACGKGEENV